MRTALIALIAAAALVSAPAAVAGTQIGSSTAADRTCGAGSTVFQWVPPGVSYTVPDGGGIITSWAFNAGDDAGIRKLKLVRQYDPSRYLIAGESGAERAVPGRRNTFGTRIRVAGGEVLGFYTATGVDCGAAATQGFPSNASGDLPEGTLFSPGLDLLFAPSAPRVLDVTATIEPDADGDGYGDETQDYCPVNPEVFATACHADLRVSLEASPEAVRIGENVTYTMRAANAGPIAARGTVLRQALPRGAAVVSVSDECTGFEVIECRAGDIAAGRSTGSYRVVVRAPDAGRLASTATATSDTHDPDPGNDSASATVNVAAVGFGGLRVSRRAVRPAKGLVRVSTSCPIAARTCTGALKLTTAGRVRAKRGAQPRKIVLGKARFKLKGGKRKAVRVRLNATARRYIAAKRRVRVIASVVSVDAFDQRATRRVSFAVLSERRARSRR